MPHKDPIKAREYSRQYNEKNKEKIKERSRRYKAKHRDQINEQQRQYRRENSEKLKEYQKKHHEAHKQERREYSQKYREKYRSLIFDHYGNKCACCGESTQEFLTIDHINNDGAEHRKRINNIYVWIVKNNFPNGFQILCWNCNSAKAFYGECPHKRRNVDDSTT